MKHLKTILTVVAGAALITGFVTSLTAADDLSKKAPKDIKEVMEWTHKGRESMAARVRDGKGSKDEIATLLRFYKFMATQKAPEGDAASWKEKTTTLIAATEKLHKGEPSGVELFKQAVNCKACHDVHKPKE